MHGGTFEGYAYSGMYFTHESSGEAYVENATIRKGEYKGKHDKSKIATKDDGSLKLNSTNMEVFVDRCKLTTTGTNTIVLSDADGEKNSKLYISNSTIENGKKVRIDENQKLFVGKGTNITTANVSSADRVEFTNEEYKR